MSRETLIEKYHDINVDFDWWDFTYDDFRERLERAGIRVGQIEFSGFSSQGDGARFDMAGHNMLDLLTAAIQWQAQVRKEYENGSDGELCGDPVINALDVFTREMEEQLSSWQLSPTLRGHLDNTGIEITVSGGYCHSGGMYLGSKADYEDEDNGLGSDALEWLRDNFRALADALYEALNEEYDHLTSEDAVWETIVANELDKDDEDEDEDEDENPETTEERALCCA